MDGTVRVLIVDDHEVVRTGLRLVLDQDDDLTVVGEAATACAAIELVASVGPDIAIVDLTLPDRDGLDLIRDVRARCPTTRCVVFSATTATDRVLAAARSGAVGYLDKATPHDRLLWALHAIAAGQTLLRPSLLDRVRRDRAQEFDLDPSLAGLTGQERRIVGMVVDGLTNREIAARLGIHENTVRNYVSSILSKTGMANRTQLAVYVTRRQGRVTSSAGPTSPGTEGTTVFDLAMAELAST